MVVTSTKHKMKSNGLWFLIDPTIPFANQVALPWLFNVFMRGLSQISDGDGCWIAVTFWQALPALGASISMMAYNGLFILVTSYGLEYPSFSYNLYRLLEPSRFVSKHHVQFFKVAFLVASSLKRRNNVLIFWNASYYFSISLVLHNKLWDADIDVIT